MIRVDVLGGLRISDADRVHMDLPHQPMRAALLVLLAVERSLTRDRVLATLWPDRDSERGRRALNQTVYELRRTLGEGVIVVSGDQLAAGASVHSDAAVFQEALANGDRAAALELYRGPFLSGVFLAPTNEFEEWCSRHRSRLVRLERKLRLEHIDELVQQGRAAAALPYALRAVEEDALEDDFQHRLIALLVATGQRAAALRQYDLYGQRLAEQGLTPLDETRELIAGLRSFPAVPTAAPAPGEAAAEAPASREPSAVRVTPWRRLRQMSLWPLAAGLVLAVMATMSILRTSLRGPAAASDAGAEAVTSVPRVTVVVFEDLSPEPRYGYLARGLTESLVDALQRRLPRVRVVALDEAALAARVAAGGAPPAGAGLGVPGVSGGSASLRLDGSVTVQQDSVRVRVRLVDMSTGELVRPIEVRRPWQSELALIDSVVPAIVQEMRPVLGQHLRRLQLRAGTTSAEAFALFLKASESREVAARLSDAGDHRGAALLLAYADSVLERAGKADPRWGHALALRARVGEARAFLAAAEDGDIGSPRVVALLRESLRQAEAAVERAPGSAAALTARGHARFTMVFFSTANQSAEFERSMREGAEHDLHRAVSIDPLAAEAWSLLSTLHNANGEWRKAYAAAHQAYRADAFLRHEADILDQLFTASFQLHRDEEAGRWCTEVARRSPGTERPVICRALYFAYRDPPAVDSVLQAMQEARVFPRGTSIPMVTELAAAYALARIGQADRALALVQESRRLGRGADEGLHFEAAVLHAVGRSERGIELLREFTRRSPHGHAVLKARWLDGLRTHPDFPQPTGR